MVIMGFDSYYYFSAIEVIYLLSEMTKQDEVISQTVICAFHCRLCISGLLWNSLPRMGSGAL